MTVLFWCTFTSFVTVRYLFHDPGSAIFVCPTRHIQLTMVKICERNGIKPAFRIDTPGVIQRAIMDNGWIFNYVLDDSIQERLGNPRAAFALVTDNPDSKSHEDAAFLRNEQMRNVRIIRGFDPGVPEENLVALRFQEGEDRFCIIYRKHFMKMGKKPPAWKWEEVKDTPPSN